MTPNDHRLNPLLVNLSSTFVALQLGVSAQLLSLVLRGNINLSRLLLSLSIVIRRTAWASFLFSASADTFQPRSSPRYPGELGAIKSEFPGVEADHPIGQDSCCDSEAQQDALWPLRLSADAWQTSEEPLRILLLITLSLRSLGQRTIKLVRGSSAQ